MPGNEPLRGACSARRWLITESSLPQSADDPRLQDELAPRLLQSGGHRRVAGRSPRGDRALPAGAGRVRQAAGKIAGQRRPRLWSGRNAAAAWVFSWPRKREVDGALEAYTRRLPSSECSRETLRRWHRRHSRWPTRTATADCCWPNRSQGRGAAVASDGHRPGRAARRRTMPRTCACGTIWRSATTASASSSGSSTGRGRRSLAAGRSNCSKSWRPSRARRRVSRRPRAVPKQSRRHSGA